MGQRALPVEHESLLMVHFEHPNETRPATCILRARRRPRRKYEQKNTIETKAQSCEYMHASLVYHYELMIL